jgi:hypothetical protein
MLAGLLLLITVTLRCCPGTSAAQWIQRMLVDGTRARLATLERRHLIFVVLMATILIFGGELLAMAGPFDMALVVLWDVSTYVDIVVTTAVVATAARAGLPLRNSMTRLLPRRAGRTRRTRAVRKELSTAKDDDDRPARARAGRLGPDCHGRQFGYFYPTLWQTRQHGWRLTENCT